MSADLAMSPKMMEVPPVSYANTPIMDDTEAAQLDGVYFNANDPLKDYLRNISKAPLLSAEEEVQLSKKIEAGVMARAVMEGSVSPTHESLKDIKEAELQKIIDEGNFAFNSFMVANLRLVVSIAKKYNRNDIPLLDLVQEGNFGLIRAIKKFDYKKGYKFSTYGTWWIKQTIQRSIHSYDIIRLPVHVNESVSKLKATERKYFQEAGRMPSEQELADEMGEDVATVNKLLQHIKILSPTSLNAMLAESDTELGDHLARDESFENTTDDHILNQEITTRIGEILLRVLDYKAADIIERRFAIGNYDEPQTLKNIGEAWGITAERVRQIEKKAMEVLKNNCDDLRDLL